MSIENSLGYITESLQSREIYPKIAEMIDYIIDGAQTDLADTKDKFRDPDNASEERLTEIINEYGFGYINNIIDTLTNIELNILLHFISLLHLLKGHRDGMELVLTLLGFNFDIKEWWEVTPKKEPHTFDMDIFMDLSIVSDVFKTLDRVRSFAKEYVYPKFEIANITFTFEFAEATVAHAGFVDQERFGDINGTL